MLRTKVVSTVLLLAVGVAGAQPDEANRAKVRHEVHEWAMQQVITEVGLDPAAQQRFRTVDARYQPQLEAARGQVRQAMHALKQGGGANSATVAKLTDDLLAARQKAQAIEAQRRADLRGALSPQQFAQLIMVWPKIQRSIRARIWKSTHPGADPNTIPQGED